MLTPEQIEANKQRFLELISSITIEGSDIEGLNRWLEKSDFFVAPASTKYHCAYPGGLCEHSLHVYDALVKLVKEFKTTYKTITNDVVDEETGIVTHNVSQIENCEYSDDTIKVVALLHDISKANFYEKYLRNVKNEDTGKWEQVEEFRKREDTNRFIYGSHEQNAEYMIHTFFPLSLEESSAVLHHHGGMGFDSTQDDVGPVFKHYNLACLLHTADLISTFIVEAN